MTTTDSRPATLAATPKQESPAGPDSLTSQASRDAHGTTAGEGHHSGPASPALIPNPVALARQDSLSSQSGSESQGPIAAEGQNSPQAIQHPISRQHAPAGINLGQPAAKLRTKPIGEPLLADPLLALAADVIDDLEAVWVANANRLRQLTRSEADADGQERGFGLDDAHPDVARLAALVAMLDDAQHKATLNLERMMRRHPLGPWMKAQKGVGDKQGARLLAAIGDPYWNDLHDRPRTVSELWAFCGYHVIKTPASGQRDHGAHEIIAAGGIAPRRQRGQQSNWSDTARKRAWLIASKCIMFADSPYRPVYDARRAKDADAIHQQPCVRCGPSGKPAQPWSALSDGHKHARALRAVAKEILKDLWREAKRLHEAAK